MKSPDSLLDELNLQEFQKRTAKYAFDRMYNKGQRRFLVADEVGLGKTKVAQGVMALATQRMRQPNVLYLASSGHIIGQNLAKLQTKRLSAEGFGSLSLLAEKAYGEHLHGKLIGLTPIKDLRADHFGSVRERALLFKLLRRPCRSLMAQKEVRDFFKGNRVGDKTFDSHLQGSVPLQLRRDFERLLDPIVIEELSNPTKRKKHKRAIVGALRAILARCVLEKLKPALIVVDEIQRFSGILFDSKPTPQVDYLLERPMLVLSATPYQPGTPGDHSGPNAHKGFMELVQFLNIDSQSEVIRVNEALSHMRQTLQKTALNKVEIQDAVEALGMQLRAFMVRTERPFDAHVKQSGVSAKLEEADLVALRQVTDLLGSDKLAKRGKQLRLPELIELWKSAPYIASALGERYVTGRELERRLAGRRVPAPAGLTISQLRRKASVEPLSNPRLRAMVEKMGTDANGRRLWLPPTLSYVEDLHQAPENPASKTLIFTSWNAAPPAIATALNLLVERRPARPKDLGFSRKVKNTEISKPVRSVYVLAAPLWQFAEKSDPFEAFNSVGKALSWRQMILEMRKQLVDSGLLQLSRTASMHDFVSCALGLNAEASYPRKLAREPSYLAPARELMAETQVAEMAAVNSQCANDLAELSAAGPGTCAYRALRRAIPRLSEDKPALFQAAISIGNSITRMFQRPSAVAIVEYESSFRKEDYWRKVLRFCLENDLQSVLDEYVFWLVSDSSESAPGKLAAEVAEVFRVALKTVGGLSVARPKAKSGSPLGAAIFARALGEPDSLEEDEDLPSGSEARKGRHASPLLTAFNSPFPPFVMATTSTGQEGLDMHRYCRRLVHWNLPSTPLALEQREGRIDRYLSLGVRTSIGKLNIAKRERCEDFVLANPWQMLVQAAKDSTGEHKSILSPFWHFGQNQSIEALAINVCFSREETAWKRLKEEAGWYRLVLGQPDPHALLDRISNSSESNRFEIKGIRLDLSPPMSP